MFRPRIIPVLLLSNGAAVKTKQFANPTYLGDIINTARIFSEFGADELIVLDIDATKEKRCINTKLVGELSKETGMPLAVGGGIQSTKEIAELINAGAEKVILGTSAFLDEVFLLEAVNAFGSSTISVCIDVRKDKEIEVRFQNGLKKSTDDLKNTIQNLEQLGVGEIIIQSINNDGMRMGYDLETVSLATTISTVPVVALGGASSLEDISTAFKETNCNAFAASSLFVFYKNGVLISYPEKSQMRQLFTR